MQSQGASHSALCRHCPTSPMSPTGLRAHTSARHGSAGGRTLSSTRVAASWQRERACFDAKRSPSRPSWPKNRVLPQSTNMGRPLVPESVCQTVCDHQQGVSLVCLPLVASAHDLAYDDMSTDFHATTTTMTRRSHPLTRASIISTTSPQPFWFPLKPERNFL